MQTAISAVLASTAALAVYLVIRQLGGGRNTNEAPGPDGLPIVGNTFQVPAIQTWRYFDRLASKYGPLVKLSLGGDNILVLCDPKDANELLGRRSHNYSSRKPLVYAGKYQSNNHRLVLLPYGEKLRRQRAAFHQMVQPRAVGAYEAIQEIESVKLLYEMLNQPADYTRHCQRFSASLVFHLSYGKRLGDHDGDLQAVIKILEGFIRDTYPGSHLVDTFPILDILPDFLAPWRNEALRKHEVEIELYQRLARQVKERMDQEGSAVECFAARLWDASDSMELTVEELAYLAGSAFEAGTDTTMGTMLWFLMAMLLYSDTMKRAQEEIDSVVGADGSTIPGFVHIDSLPYCVALTKEVFRWAPAAPGGFPHYSDASDEYKGYKIEAKTMVIPNIWSMHRNPDEFPKPEVFNPDRFLRAGDFEQHDSMVEGHYGFGFGRRKCPGQYLASKTIWIGIVRLLWAFNISRVEGDHTEIHPDNCTSGMTSKPLHFPAQIKIRSDTHARTVEREWGVNK